MKKGQRKYFSGFAVFFLFVLPLFLFGCAIAPNPLSHWERSLRVDQDVKSIFGGQQDYVTRPIGLYEAMARALKYNLDGRLKLMEIALSQEQFDLSTLSMLPKMAASAGYTTRDNTSASVSKTVFTHVKSLEPSSSLERDVQTANLQIAWNILDFGVSYYQAKQDANRVLVARERRRKVIHNLLQDVRAAYWKAYAAQQLLPELEELVEKAENALEDARSIEKEMLQAPAQALDYQMTLMETLRDINGVKKELLQAQIKLASLMNLKPGSQYELRGPENNNYGLPAIKSRLSEIEWLALMNRPELREEDYQLQIGRLETRKAIFKLLPGLEFSASRSYDSNSYLFNENWSQAAFRVGWNLFNPIEMKKHEHMANAREAVDTARRQALSMAILTQVHVAWGRYRSAMDEHEINVELSEVAERMAEQTENAVKLGAVPEAEFIRSEARASFLRMRKEMSFAELQDSAGSIYVTVGLDPVPGEVYSYGLFELAGAIEKAMSSWDLGRFTEEDMPRLPKTPSRKPIVSISSPIKNRRIMEAEPFEFSINKELFAEAELGDSAIYTATLDSGAPLPSWLYFDAIDVSFSGNPGAANVGVFPIRIRAHNEKGEAAEGSFILTVQRGYARKATLQGAGTDSKVLVIGRCKRGEPCKDYYHNSSGVNDGNGQVFISPVINRR